MQHITSQYVLRTRSLHLLTTFTQFPHPGTPTPSNHKSGFWVCYRLHTQSDITQYLSLSVWLPSLSKTSSRSIHVVANVRNSSIFFFFYDWGVFHCIPHFLYPLIRRWTLRLFPRLRYCKSCCNNQGGTDNSSTEWFLPLDIYSEVELLDGKDLFFNF